MYGNNLNSERFYRMRVPLYTTDGDTPTGIRFYFPDNPEIDKQNIKGIEAHIAPNLTIPLPGDLRDARSYSGLNSKSLLADLAKYVFVTVSGSDLSEKNFMFPLNSLINLVALNGKYSKRVKPIIGKIKTRNCYLIIPANTPITIQGNYDVNLTFYY